MKQPLSQTIVQTSLEMFKQNGIKKVKMDDIAHTLGISKRTLYETYEDKETLLLECIRQNDSRLEKQRHEYIHQAKGPMDIVVFYIRQQLEEFSKCNPRFFIEAMKYNSVKNYLSERRENEKSLRQTFIRKGIRNGYFSSDLNYQLLEHISHMVAMQLISEKAYKDYELQDIFRTFILVFLRGILTEKGIIDQNKHLNNID